MTAAEPLADIPVNMVRAHLGDLLPATFPNGFGMRPLRPGLADAPLWTEIQREAVVGEFEIKDDLFAREFGGDLEAIVARCFFITDPANVAVGTISAWMRGRGENAENWGRIHWVATRPAFQRRGLGRAGLAFTLNRLAELGHERAWLSTSTALHPALKLYLDAGFVPDLEPASARDAWHTVRARLPHPALADALGGF